MIDDTGGSITAQTAMGVGTSGTIFFAEHEGDKLATMIVFTSGRKY